MSKIKNTANNLVAPLNEPKQKIKTGAERTINGAIFVPVAETGFAKAGKLLPAFVVGLKMATR